MIIPETLSADPRVNPVKSRNLTREVVDFLTGEIINGNLTEGQKLPTEAEFMGQFGVSRTVVREAISKLQASGLVLTRHGIGTFVLPKNTQPAFRVDPADLQTLKDVIALIELRTGIESEAAAMAAARIQPEQLERMQQAMSDFNLAVEAGTDAVSADWAFHTEIARATQNNYFTNMMLSLGVGAIPRSRLQSGNQHGSERQSYLKRVNQEHESIFSAIAAGDSEAARAAMRAHLSNSRERHRRGESGHV